MIETDAELNGARRDVEYLEKWLEELEGEEFDKDELCIMGVQKKLERIQAEITGYLVGSPALQPELV